MSNSIIEDIHLDYQVGIMQRDFPGIDCPTPHLIWYLDIDYKERV